jgi:hypothetical protein
VSWLDPCKVRRVTVVGSQKMAVYNDLADQERVRIYNKGVVTASDEEDGLHDPPMSYRYGDIVSPFISFQEPLSLQDQHFIQCIESGRRPLTDGLSGLAVVHVLESVQQSLREARPVTLDPKELAPLRSSTGAAHNGDGQAGHRSAAGQRSGNTPTRPRSRSTVAPATIDAADTYEPHWIQVANEGTIRSGQ